MLHIRRLRRLGLFVLLTVLGYANASAQQVKTVFVCRQGWSENNKPRTLSWPALPFSGEAGAENGIDTEHGEKIGGDVLDDDVLGFAISRKSVALVENISHAGKNWARVFRTRRARVPWRRSFWGLSMALL